MTTTTAQVHQPNNQVRTTIPKSLALAMGVKQGTKIEWRVAGKNKLELHIQE